MKGRHPTTKSPNSSTYSPEWSGVSYAPTARGRYCSNCGGHVHREAGEYYCPNCDDYVHTASGEFGLSDNSIDWPHL